MPPSWRLVFMGTPEPAAATLEALGGGPDPLVGVVTQPDRPAGRGRALAPSPVRRAAEARSIPVVAPERLRDADFLRTLEQWAPDLIVVVAYGRILPREVLDLPPHGCVNVHYSLLPKYRGAAPVPWAILNGESVTGVTTIALVERMDAGPILMQERVEIAPRETTASLTSKLVPLGSRLLLETIAALKEGRLEPRPQSEDEASYAPMLKKEDGRIDWARSAAFNERAVRAFDPWPSAYTEWRGKLLKVHRARVATTAREGAPGEVLRADGGGLWVACGEGVLSLEEVQLENRRRMAAAEFVKGARVRVGERL
jgi:methionyl-tRNA formyltransferase